MTSLSKAWVVVFRVKMGSAWSSKMLVI